MEALAGNGVDAFAMAFLPLISRAQAMGVPSSQANPAGHEAAPAGVNAPRLPLPHGPHAGAPGF